MTQRQHPFTGSAYISTNYNQPQNPYPQIRHIPGVRKTSAEYEAEADRLIKEMLASLDARTAKIVAGRDGA